MQDLHFIAKLYDPKTGEYLGKFDVSFNEIVGSSIKEPGLHEHEQMHVNK